MRRGKENEKRERRRRQRTVNGEENREEEEHEMCFNISPFYKSNMKEWSISQEELENQSAKKLEYIRGSVLSSGSTN